jgi:hypothetical protein
MKYEVRSSGPQVRYTILNTVLSINDDAPEQPVTNLDLASLELFSTAVD